jgi:hypothetical protein
MQQQEMAILAAIPAIGMQREASDLQRPALRCRMRTNHAVEVSTTPEASFGGEPPIRALRW